MKSAARLGFIAISVAIAIGAIIVWFYRFAVSEAIVVDLLGRIQWWSVPIIGLFLAGHILLAGWRWILIEVSIGGDRPSLQRAWVFGALGVALGTFMPPPLMSVAVRGLSNRLSGASALRGAISGTIDQFADIAVVALMAVPSVLGVITSDFRVFGVAAVASALFGVLVLPMLPRAIRRFPRLGERFGPALGDVALLQQIYALSLLRVANLTVLTLLIMLASGAGNFVAIVIGVPVISLAIAVAMLPGALGVSEWSFSAVFTRFDVPPDEIVAFVLANRLILTGLSLLLGVIAAGVAVWHSRAPSGR